MNYFVCSVTLINLCLGNVAGFGREQPPEPATPVAHHSIEKIESMSIESIHSSVKERFFLCDSKTESFHQWYHVYPNGSRQKPTYIGNIPIQTKVKTTLYIIQLETFDYNTVIHCASGGNVLVETKVKYFHLFDDLIKTYLPYLNSKSIYLSSNFITNEISEDSEEPAVLKYNETQKVSFKCLKYKYKTNLVTGVINTTSNMIKTYNKTFPDTTFNKSQNGTVLCCIYHDVIRIASSGWITRHVAKKTLLLYDETVTVPVPNRQDLEEKVLDNKSSNSTGKDTNHPDVDIGNQVTTPGNQDANSGTQDADSGNLTTIILIVSAVAVLFILLVVSVIYLKRCRKKPKVEVETRVLYADLDLLRRNEPESLPREAPEEESPYAQIVGKLRPQ